MFQDFKDVRHSLNSDRPFINMYKKTKKNIDYLMYLQQCIVFRKAYILSGPGFHEFLYSIIESLRKIREIAEFIPNQLRFHEKKTLANFRDIIEKCKKTLF